MRTMCCISVLLTAVASFPMMAAEDRPAMIAASQEVDRQISLFQELYGEDTDLAAIGGIFNQTMGLQAALIQFRQKVNAKAASEDVALAFDVVDSAVTAILGEVAALEVKDAGLRLICRRLRSAESDLHYAVFVADVTPARQLAVLNRQISTQQIFVSCLANNVKLVFAGKEALNGWKDDVGAVEESLVALQGLMQKKAPEKELKEQVVRTDKLWNKIVQRYNDSKQNRPALQGFVSLVDQRFAKLAKVVGVNDRRIPLTD
jgi:hypothetical protein